MGIWICVIWIVIIIAMYMLTKSYGKEKWKKVDKSKYKLWMIYGMAMFLVDRPLRRVLQKSNRVLEDKFKIIYVKEKVQREKYLYIVSKVSLVIVIIFVAAVLGVGMQLINKENKSRVTYIKRNDFNEGEKVYDLEVEAEGESETIKIVVPPQVYTDEKIAALLEEYREELVTELLGENSSPDQITNSLNMVTVVGEEQVPVIWELGDAKAINEDGTIASNIPPEGVLNTIRATLILNGISVTHEIALHVFPAAESSNLEGEVQKIVDEYDSGKKKIILPNEIKNQKISFFQYKDDSVQYFFPICLITAIAIFILKDKEIEHQIKERNRQLMLDYSEVVSKIMLLSRAGMSMRQAWDQTIKSSGSKSSHYVYREMKMALAKINGGIPEGIAYEQFGKRCGVHCYIRLANILSQNLKRGTNDLYRALENEMGNALQERKNSALRKGEEAGTKLLVPMVIMLVLGLSLIVIPAFMSVQI